MMNAAAPDGTTPQRFGSLPLFKPFARRGPKRSGRANPKEGGLTLKSYKKRLSDFHISGVNPVQVRFNRAKILLKKTRQNQRRR